MPPVAGLRAISPMIVPKVDSSSWANYEVPLVQYTLFIQTFRSRNSEASESKE